VGLGAIAMLLDVGDLASAPNLVAVNAIGSLSLSLSL
jgi:hypothetical protein